jgi:hypothetical protein
LDGRPFIFYIVNPTLKPAHPLYKTFGFLKGERGSRVKPKVL